MKLYLFNEDGDQVIDIKGTLEEYYDLLNCRCIDIVERRVGDTYFAVICDDEGLLKENPRISAVDEDCNPMLVGNLIFSHTDDDGETVGITDEDIKTLEYHRTIAFINKTIYEVMVLDY